MIALMEKLIEKLPVRFCVFFFVFALCVIYVPGFFVADFSPLRTTNYRSRLRRPAKLVWLDSPFRRGLLRFVFFFHYTRPAIITPPVYGSGGCSVPTDCSGAGCGFGFTALIIFHVFFCNLLWWQKVTRDPKANRGRRWQRYGGSATNEDETVTSHDFIFSKRRRFMIEKHIQGKLLWISIYNSNDWIEKKLTHFWNQMLSVNVDFCVELISGMSNSFEFHWSFP